MIKVARLGFEADWTAREMTNVKVQMTNEIQMPQ